MHKQFKAMSIKRKDINQRIQTTRSELKKVFPVISAKVSVKFNSEENHPQQLAMFLRHAKIWNQT